MAVISRVVRARFDEVVNVAQIQPFSVTPCGPCKIVTLDVVGHQLVEQVLHDMTDEIRNM